MNRHAWLLTVVVCAVSSQASTAAWRFENKLEKVNHVIHGHVYDHTQHHGADRRIWSPALGQKRDVYVYVPPGFDPQQQYPVIMWLHGFAQDEQSFLDFVVLPIDEVISEGKLPPVIVVAPDGSIKGQAEVMTAGSFFINSQAGRFADYIAQDVWSFVRTHYPIRPEREAHVLAGVSMGGGGAYNLAMKNRDQFKVVLGFFPPVNIRWLDCHGRYMGNFDPNCWGWRTDFTRNNEVVGRFYGVVMIRLRDIVDDIYGKGPDILDKVIHENPIEMLDHLGIKEGDLSMYIAYGGKDQFNIDAQVESFLYRTKERGLTVSVGYDPHGKHDFQTALRLFPGAVDWLAPLLAPYSPATSACKR